MPTRGLPLAPTGPQTDVLCNIKGVVPEGGLLTDPSKLSCLSLTMGNQKWWTSEVVKVQADLLLAGLAGNYAVRFAFQQRPHSMAWAAANLSAPLKTFIPPAEFRALTQRSLGWQVCPTKTDGSFPECPRCLQQMVVGGIHVVCCTKQDTFWRRGALQTFVFSLAKRPGFMASRKRWQTSGRDLDMSSSRDSTEPDQGQSMSRSAIRCNQENPVSSMDAFPR